MAGYKTEQENFWHGSFGDDYISRNKDNKIFSSNIGLFAKIFSRLSKVENLIEFGSNIGLNLLAIRQLLPQAKLSAIEINQKAAEELESIGYINVYQQSILEFAENAKWDVCLIKGVLIHINPEELPIVYEKLYNASNKYICIVEYYNPKPVEVDYRGHSGKLFKRDFAGEMLDKFPALKLLDYGFAYHRDSNFPQDDLTWFLLEKTEVK